MGEPGEGRGTTSRRCPIVQLEKAGRCPAPYGPRRQLLGGLGRDWPRAVASPLQTTHCNGVTACQASDLNHKGEDSMNKKLAIGLASLLAAIAIAVIAEPT